MATGTLTSITVHSRFRATASTRAAVLAGSLLMGAGVIILMGIITAEAMYDATYTTFDNEISDLGATRPPDSVSYQPSAAIFNITMLVTGAMVMGAAVFLHPTLGARRATISTGLLGLGVFGVGVFPGNYGSIHPWFALLAFTSGGLAGILVGTVLTGPMRLVSIALGATTLVCLAIGMAGEGSIFFDHLGDGGVERWIAYPVVLWMVAMGGDLIGRAEG
jgi:hypothetical membrane protein